MASKIKVYDVTVPIDREQGKKTLRKEIWPTLRPEWTTREILTQDMNTGYINTMTIYHTSDDVDEKNALMVRVFNAEVISEEIRDREFIQMQIAEHMGCFATIYAVFNNGVIYECAPGRCLLGMDLENPQIIDKVARALAKFHWFTPSATANLIDRKGNKTDFKLTNIFMDQMKQDLAEGTGEVPNETEEQRISIENTMKDMEKEMIFLEEYLDGLDLPVSNTHWDFHSNNIVYDDKTGRVTIVDYELSVGGNFAMFDFSLLFSMHLFHDLTSKIDTGTTALSDEIKKLWITAYVSQKYELEGRDVKEVTDDVIDLWMTHLAILEVISCVSGSVFCLRFVKTDFGELSMRTVIVRLMKLYFEEKPSLQGLKEKYIGLSSKLASEPAQ